MLSESGLPFAISADELNVLNLSIASSGRTSGYSIRMITAMCIANGGKLMKPYVVQQILDSDGNIISNTEPVVKRQVISESTSKRISKMLADSVNGGGAKNAYIPGYRMAGKTGTSDKTDQNVASNTKNVVASFAGFAPADNPKYAILVMIDEPQTEIRFGGTIAAPVAQKICPRRCRISVSSRCIRRRKRRRWTPPRMLPAKGIGRAVHAGERQPEYQVVGNGIRC